jgi:hypothetical protein
MSKEKAQETKTHFPILHTEILTGSWCKEFKREQHEEMPVMVNYVTEIAFLY